MYMQPPFAFLGIKHSEIALLIVSNPDIAPQPP